jgi:ParB family transcriptional regulator, chromosome partitioning protein
MTGKAKGGLGRGLGALIPQGPPVTAPSAPPIAESVAADMRASGPSSSASAPARSAASAAAATAVDDGPQLAPVPGARFAELLVDSISPNTRQPRQVFDEEALEELKTSIREVGFLQPIVVREAGPGSYELVMGERRWRAAQQLGFEAIPAIIRETRDDSMLLDALLENIHRANLNPLEEAAAYQQLLEEFGATHEELAKRIGRSRPQISNTIRLLNLPNAVQLRVAAGVLSAGHARALLALERSDQQEVLAGRIVAEGMSVRATEEAVAVALAEGAPAKKAAVKRAKPHAPGLNDLADRLSDHFETRVRVEIGRRKGRILVEFATVDDLERIVGMLGMPPA